MALRFLPPRTCPAPAGAVRQRDGRVATYYRVHLQQPQPPRRAYLGVRHLPMPALLESAAGLPEIAQRSILVANPSETFVSSEPHDLLVALREWWSTETGETEGAIPAPGPGVYGVLAYEAARAIERLPATTHADVPVPLACFGRYDAAAVWDHVNGTCTVWGRSGVGPEHAAELMAPLLHAAEHGGSAPAAEGLAARPVCSTHDWAAYRAMVERARAYIRAGDIFQANLAQRLSVDWNGDAWTLYDRLMRINPSPFSVLADLGTWQVISCSPERLVRVVGERVETRPIAGTRPRGRSVAEDAALRHELSVDPKECAEHIMIVDMARNDIGRLCEYGSVHPVSLAHVEAYSHVWHIVTEVAGRARAGVDPWDVIAATFPGASITGVPKVRCMEIIDELEPVQRGAYTGSFGWMAPTGDCDWNILIRTMQLRDGCAHVHVGGGVVAESEPEREYRETWAKAGALLEALGACPPAQP